MDNISTLAGLNSRTPVEIIINYIKPPSLAETLFQYKVSLHSKRNNTVKGSLNKWCFLELFADR
jgi:hypothetical protein